MSDVIYLSSLDRSLPPAPDSWLDSYLDAATACFARHGISRTSITDIANELGVSRTTVYRQLGSVDRAVGLIIARELQRFVARLPEAIGDRTGGAAIVKAAAEVVRYAWSHPLVSRLLQDDAELLAQLVLEHVPGVFNRAAAVLVTPLEVAMAAGIIRRHDPVELAHWLTRVGAVLIAAPPPGDLERMLTNMLLPILEP